MRLQPASSSVLSAYIPTMTVTTYILNANYDHHPNLMLTNTNYGVITAESHGNVFLDSWVKERYYDSLTKEQYFLLSCLILFEEFLLTNVTPILRRHLRKS